MPRQVEKSGRGIFSTESPFADPGQWKDLIVWIENKSWGCTPVNSGKEKFK